MLNKCGLCYFRCFIQLIKVTVSFESLFFVRSVFCIFVFVFVFSPVSLYFIFSCLGLLESLLLRHFLFFSSRFLIFHTFCAFSSLGFTFLFLPIFSFPASFQAFQILLHCPGMGILRFVRLALCQTKYYFMGASRWEATAARVSVPSAS